MRRNGEPSAQEQAFAYFAAGNDGTDLSLAALFGCQPQTIKRYRQSWLARQRQVARPPQARHHGNPAPWKALVCAILTRAVRDYRLGKPCGAQCRPGRYHRCASDAAVFLRGQMAGFLFDAIEMSRGKVLRQLGLEADNDTD